MESKWIVAVLLIMGGLFLTPATAATNLGNCSSNTSVASSPTLDLWANPTVTGTTQAINVTWTITSLDVTDNATAPWIVLNGVSNRSIYAIWIGNSTVKLNGTGMGISLRDIDSGHKVNISWGESAAAAMVKSGNGVIDRTIYYLINDTQASLTTNNNIQTQAKFNSSDFLSMAITATIRMPLPASTDKTTEIWTVQSSTDGATYTTDSVTFLDANSDGKYDCIQDTASLSSKYYKIDLVAEDDDWTPAQRAQRQQVQQQIIQQQQGGSSGDIGTQIMSFFNENVNIAGYNIPMWLILLALFVILVFVLALVL